MVEVIQLINKFLFIPIPLPFDLQGTVLYFNLFGVFIFFFLISLISYIIDRSFNGGGNKEWFKL